MFIQITILHSFLCWLKVLFRNEYIWWNIHCRKDKGQRRLLPKKITQSSELSKSRRYENAVNKIHVEVTVHQNRVFGPSK